MEDLNVTSSLYNEMRNGNPEKIQELLRNAAQVAPDLQIYLQSALNFAVQSSNALVVRELLSFGADVNKVNELMYDTPLHRAVLRNDPQVDVVRELIRWGAHVNAQNYKERIPLHLSLYKEINNGRLDIIKELLQCGADVAATDYNSSTPLHTAIKRRSLNADTLQVLLKFGADINAKQKDGRSVLNLAASSGQVKVVQELLACGADINAFDLYGVTPILGAIMSPEGSPEVIKELIAKGANVNNEGVTPLLFACLCKKDVVKLLLQNGADTNAMDITVQATAFIYIVQKMQYDLIVKFLQFGVKFDLQEIFSHLNLCQFAPAVDIIKVFILYNFVQKADCLDEVYEELFSDNIMSFLKRLIFARADFETYISECVVEVKKMSQHFLHCNLSVWNCVFSDASWCHTDIIESRMLEVLTSEMYPFFNRIMIKKLSREFFISGIMSQHIYSCSDNFLRKVTLNSYCVKKLARYLSKKDLLHLFQAFNMNTTTKLF